MEDNNAKKMKRTRLSDKAVDAHHREIGFVKDGYIYKFLENDKKNGEAWLRMQKTDEIGKKKRKYLLFFGDETEPCAYVDTYNDTYDITGENYLFSIERSAFLMLLLLFFLSVFVVTSIAIFFTGDLLLQNAYWSSEIDSIDLSITDGMKEWDPDNPGVITELDIFGFEQDVTDTEDEIIETKKKEDLVWPGATGEYQFKLENVCKKALLYKAKFSEENEYSVPMKFRLKLDGEYVAGAEDKWVNADELNTETQKLMPDRKDIYTLEWIWLEEDDEYDTKLGAEAIAEYKFTITIDCCSAY